VKICADVIPNEIDLEKAKGVEKRYIESISGEMEKDHASES
jgi:hypothetical protein